jgi:hypothetical protein
MSTVTSDPVDTWVSTEKGDGMVALVVVSTFVVVLLGILVAGLLRSHADILRSLHELGVGVGDPATVTAAPASVAVAPPRPSEATTAPAAPTVAGVTPAGDARAIAVANGDQLTLLGFLSSGCTTCTGFWHALQTPERLDLPEGTRVVIVTKGPELEIPAEVGARATGRVPVVMSTEAWVDYQVPGSPFFVLVDGATGRVIGQGVASQVGQLVELVRRAQHDRAPRAASPPPRAPDSGLGGPAREAAADDVLLAAGIRPGDRSLYPASLDDLFPYPSAVTTGQAGAPDAAARAE